MAHTNSASEISVSVVIPAYNACDTISDALASVRAQTVQPREIIVVDDGSTDGTGDLLRRRFPDVMVVPQPRGGPSVARNTGVDQASSPWIAFLDADDVWESRKLERQLAQARSASDVGLVYAGWNRPGRRPPSRDEGRVVPLDFLQVLSGYFIGPSGVLASREAILDAGGFRPDRDGIEDRDLWSRLVLRRSVVMLPSVLWSYRKNPHHAQARRLGGFLAGLALLHEMREAVGKRSGPLGWEILMSYQILRYRFYFRRDGNRDGDARCRELLSEIPATAVHWTWRHLFLPYLVRRGLSRATGQDGSTGEFLPPSSALRGPAVPTHHHPGGRADSDRSDAVGTLARPGGTPGQTEGSGVVRDPASVGGEVSAFPPPTAPVGGDPFP